MLLDPTYKTVEISDDMSLIEIKARILLRMVTFSQVGGKAILSGETITKIIGTDKWATVVLDAITATIDIPPGAERTEKTHAFLDKRIRDTLEGVPESSE